MTKRAIIIAFVFAAAAGLVLLLRFETPVGLPAKSYLVGVVSFGGAHKEAIAGLTEGLKALGYEEGVNISYDIVDAAGSDEKAKEAAVKFLGEKADAVYAVSTPVTAQVAKVITAGPIVFNIVSDPVSSGFAKSMISSGTNLTGCSNFVGQTGPKRLEILKEILPEAKKILVLYDPNNPFSGKALDILKSGGADILGVEIIAKEIYSREDVERLVRAIAPGEFDAFFHLGEAKVSAASTVVIEAANAAKLPTMAHEESLVRNGMLAAYGPSWRELGRQCASTMDKVLRGTKPTEIPIQIPERIELTVNLKTAKALGVTIPEKVLFSADRFIE